MEPYFFLDGVKELAKQFIGNENIYLGIRPYGFHAGNATTMFVYPFFLCSETEKLGKPVEYTFYIFLNDWEQEALDGPNTLLYPFNIMPKFTTWQYISDPIDNTKSIVDFWEKVIVNNVSLLKHYFHNVKIIPVRNSQMKQYQEMKQCIYKTISHPELITQTLKKYTNRKVLKKPCIYASAVCPSCHAARGNTKINEKNDIITHACSKCKKNSHGSYEEFDFWLYHKPLALPRIAVYKIDLCITGLDHFNEGDFKVRQKLFEEYKFVSKLPKTLYAPTIFSSDGIVMGKSKGNARLIDLDKLLSLNLKNKNKSKITIPDKI